MTKVLTVRTEGAICGFFFLLIALFSVDLRAFNPRYLRETCIRTEGALMPRNAKFPMINFKF